MDELHTKLQQLRSHLFSLERVAIAFSGGVDSTFLLAVAQDVLGDNVIAVTAESCTFPARERDEAQHFCTSRGIRQVICHTDELSHPAFRNNPPNRCYLCKKLLFEQFFAVARTEGISALCEGSNMDDLGDYRPGLQAIRELGVLSPLRQAGLTKAEIRQLSREMGLSTSEKPSFACLSSRFPYGEAITADKLHMVELAEEYLLSLGFVQKRVRIHGKLARLELLSQDIPRMLDPALRAKVDSTLKAIGFQYVALDLLGYRTGSMNEVLSKETLASVAPNHN